MLSLTSEWKGAERVELWASERADRRPSIGTLFTTESRLTLSSVIIECYLTVLRLGNELSNFRQITVSVGSGKEVANLCFLSILHSAQLKVKNIG